MKIWDQVKRAWKEVVTQVEAPFTEEGTADAVKADKDSDVEQGLADDEEIRHEPAYDSTLGIETMQPVVRKKGEVQ